MKRNRPTEAEIIVLCVRWYVRFGLSFRNLEELMVERHFNVDHVTIWRRSCSADVGLRMLGRLPQARWSEYSNVQ